MSIDSKTLIELFKNMVRIRQVELVIEEHYHEDQMKTPVHLCLGQEAVSVGVCSNLKKEDRIFSNHRSHGHYLAKGGNLNSMMAELFCKETGCARGRGGSMHLIDTSVGHYGSSAIVAGSIPHAVGSAMAFVMQKKDLVAVSFFGDAASEEGVLQESLNWANLKNLPVVFICENNHYSVCSHIDVRQPKVSIAKRVSGFGMPAITIDGMNAVEVYQKSREAIEYARSGKGPYFIECIVQRWRGHAGAGDPLAEQYRRKEDVFNDETVCDPIVGLKKDLLDKNVITQKEVDCINEEIDKEIKIAFEYGETSPLPDVKDLEKYLYCE
ncbi:MAG: thiamine pyrophosphate-dependent dehydrogenase E1 component subunit alpha [Candidatus Zapsychrus exili]|nr:thiamine pyrophosphate-dependent dehydrogenase E1 component subunit alpha [Candidatus Zapsychrus exili]